MYYDFKAFGYEDINFHIDLNGDYYMAALMTKDGLWRVTYGEDSNLSNEEIIARQPMKYERMLPGHPKPDSGAYKVISVNPYNLHQRCAARFRVGRILLAADAAHLCTPYGGLGLTGGMIDVGGLFDCLDGIDKGKADESILDKYDEIRRKIWHDIIDPVSSGNFLRVSSKDPDTALESDEFLQMCEKANHDPEVKKEIDQVCLPPSPALFQNLAWVKADQSRLSTTRWPIAYAMISRNTTKTNQVRYRQTGTGRYLLVWQETGKRCFWMTPMIDSS